MSNVSLGPIIKQPRKSRKRFFVVVGIILFLVLGGGSLILFNREKVVDIINNTIGSNIDNGQSDGETGNNLPVISDSTVESIVMENYDEGQSNIDEQLKDTKDKTEQAKLYLKKASIALNLYKYDEAIEFAKKSEELNPTSSSVQLMGSAYAAKGEIDSAIKSYKTAISRIDESTLIGQDDISYLQKKIDNLENQ